MTDELIFAADDEAATQPRYSSPPWTLLIVDDEPEVHHVTQLALADFRFAQRGLRFLHAHSGAEAEAILASTPDIALVLLDVVMENDRAGLDVVQFIRNRLENRFVRIVLRTGQPGQAPELEVITRYDINDYKHKTELTRERLFATVYTSLSVYRDLMALDANRKGLEKVIAASAHIFELRSAETFTQGVLEQLTALLFLDRDAVMVHAAGVATDTRPARYVIVAATGAFAGLIGAEASGSLPATVLTRIQQAIAERQNLVGEDYYVGVQPKVQNLIFYVGANAPISLPDRRMIEMFNRNVALAHENLLLIAAAGQSPANP